jgi:LysM repeat protein
LGAHSKPSRVRLPQAAGVAAVPALAGVAAAICLPATAASAATGPVATPGGNGSGTGTGATSTTGTATTGTANAATAAHAAVPAAAKAKTGEVPAGFSRPASTRLLAARGARHKPAASTYRVRPGDSLSAIASRVYHNPAAWPVLYWGNHRTIRWADVITPGQVLTIPAKPASIPAAPSRLGPSYTPKHAPAAATTEAAPAAPAAPAEQPATTTATTVPAATGGWPGGAFGACVVMRESGGNPNSWNASGHWGLYQFAYSTWVAYGGNPADFGRAGVAEQEAVFMNALARGGQGNWAPYDGC